MYGYKGTIFITFGDRKEKNDELYIQESKAKVEVVVEASSRAAGQGSGDAGAVMRNLSDPGGQQQPSPALSPLLPPLFSHQHFGIQCAFPPLFSHHHHHCSPIILLAPPHYDHHLHQPLVVPIALHKEKHARVKAHCTLHNMIAIA